MGARMKYRVRFPCGYEIEMALEKGIFDIADGTFDEEEWKSCPLHGKKCPINKNY
jgi:hypothetical protein